MLNKSFHLEIKAIYHYTVNINFPMLQVFKKGGNRDLITLNKKTFTLTL